MRFDERARAARCEPSARTIASSRDRSSSHASSALMSPIAATPAVSQYSTRVMTNVRSKMRIEIARTS